MPLGRTPIGVGRRDTISTLVTAMNSTDTQACFTKLSPIWNETSSGSSTMQAAAGVGMPVK